MHLFIGGRLRLRSDGVDPTQVHRHAFAANDESKKLYRVRVEVALLLVRIQSVRTESIEYETKVLCMLVGILAIDEDIV